MREAVINNNGERKENRKGRKSKGRGAARQGNKESQRKKHAVTAL